MDYFSPILFLVVESRKEKRLLIGAIVLQLAWNTGLEYSLFVLPDKCNRAIMEKDPDKRNSINRRQIKKPFEEYVNATAIPDKIKVPAGDAVQDQAVLLWKTRIREPEH